MSRARNVDFLSFAFPRDLKFSKYNNKIASRNSKNQQREWRSNRKSYRNQIFKYVYLGFVFLEPVNDRFTAYRNIINNSFIIATKRVKKFTQYLRIYINQRKKFPFNTSCTFLPKKFQRLPIFRPETRIDLA